MDEIAAASPCARAIIWLELRRDFAGDPRLDPLEEVLVAKRRLFAGKPRQDA